ncbi:hypothetical protein SNK04_008165 [Fusarium graminearum]
MEHSPKPPSRPRYAAMRDDQERDDQGERALDEQGVKFSQRPKPPRQVRDSHRASEPRRDRPSTRPDPRSSRRRRHSRDRSRDRAPRPSPDPSRRGPEVNDLIPRYRERRREIDDKSRRRSRSRSGSRDPTTRASPAVSKRHQSRIERSPEEIEVLDRGQGIIAPSLLQGSTVDTPHGDDAKHRLAITYGLQNPQCDHASDPQQNQNQAPGVQIEKEGPGNSHRVGHLCQSIEHLRRGEFSRYLLRANVNQTMNNSPRGDSIRQGHLTLAKNGDLERDHLAGATLQGLILKEVTMAHQAGPQVNITPIPHDPLHILPLLDLCSSILKEEAIAEVIEVAAFGAALLATEVEVVLKIPTGTKALPNGGIMTTWATEGSVTWTSPAPWTSIAWMMEMNLIKLMIEMLKMGQTVWPPLTDHPQRVRARNRSRGVR